MIGIRAPARAGTALLLAIGALAARAQAPVALPAMQGDITPVHDPVITRERGLWHVFSTGLGDGPQGLIPHRTSRDLVTWARAAAPFARLPDWAAKAVPGATNMWAPDISRVGKRYRLYYSVSTFGSNRSAIGLATSIAIFALNGYGAAVYFGEEMREPSRLIARAILASLVLTLLFEIVPTVALLMGVPDLHTVLVADDPFGLIARMRGGGWLADAIAIGVVIAIVNAIIACILACSRFFYGTARDGSWGRPLDAWMTQIHPRFGSPWVGTLIVGGVGVACCFLPLTLLLVLSGTGLVAIYAGIAIAAMVGRRTGTTDHARYRMPLYPLAPVVTLIALGYVVWTSWLDPTEGRPGLIMTGAQIAGSAAYYWFVLRRRGDWRVHVPDET